MRAIFYAGAFALTIALAAPASAQMCGGGQTQAQASNSSGMCGGMMGNAAAPGGGEQADKKSGCSCCQNMAMMDKPMDMKPGVMPEMNMPAEPVPQQ